MNPTMTLYKYEVTDRNGRFHEGYIKAQSEDVARKFLGDTTGWWSGDITYFRPAVDQFAEPTYVVPAPQPKIVLTFPVDGLADWITDVLNPIEAYVSRLVSGEFEAQFGKINTIKRLREITGIGLKEAKDQVEALLEERAAHSGVDLKAVERNAEVARSFRRVIESALCAEFQWGEPGYDNRADIAEKLARRLVKDGYDLTHP